LRVWCNSFIDPVTNSVAFYLYKLSCSLLLVKIVITAHVGNLLPHNIVTNVVTIYSGNKIILITGFVKPILELAINICLLDVVMHKCMKTERKICYYPRADCICRTLP